MDTKRLSAADTDILTEALELFIKTISSGDLVSQAKVEMAEQLLNQIIDDESVAKSQGILTNDEYRRLLNIVLDTYVPPN